MKSVTIVITNYNSGETIELCLESIRRFTAYPHEILVGDDGTKSEYYGDLAYLRAARDRGEIRLVEHIENQGHGETLNELLDLVTTDLAMVLDCDIQILGDGWLEMMMRDQKASGAALVADIEHFPDGNTALSSWFFMLDMHQYPHVRDTWEYTRRKDGWMWPGTDILGLRPTGYLIWEKIMRQKRPIVPVPAAVRAKYRHPTHISVLSLPFGTPEYAIRQARYAKIQEELRRLRASG